jgi:hypothetical protein
LLRAEIRQPPWPIEPAEADIEENTQQRGRQRNGAVLTTVGVDHRRRVNDGAWR